MKKSLLIAPVLGILLVAAAGSVGGTVAWFSASSEWKTDITSFKVSRLGGNLDCDMVARVGTKTTGEHPKTVSIDTTNNIVMTHGSYDISAAAGSGKVYVVANTSEAPYRYSDRGTEATAAGVYPTKATFYDANDTWGAKYGTSPDPNYVYAVSWQMKFTYEFGADNTNMNLYFDAVKSSATKTAGGTNDSTLESYKGFRLAFIGEHSRFVWAPNQTADKCHYIGGAQASAGLSSKGVYATTAARDEAITSPQTGDVCTVTGDKDYIYNGSWVAYNPIQTHTALDLVTKEAGRQGDEDNKTILEGGSAFNDTTTNKYHANYITTFSGAAQSIKTFTVTCVAWFEGTDPNVVNAATLDTLSASLSFFTKAQVAH